MLRHRGADSRAEDCSVQCLRDVTDQRFAPAAKMELGLLEDKIPEDAGERLSWVLPEKFGVRALAARILENSPKRAQLGDRINLNRLLRGVGGGDRLSEGNDEASVSSDGGGSWADRQEPRINTAANITRRGPRGQPPNPQAARMR